MSTINRLLLTVGGLGRSVLAPGSLGALPAIPAAWALRDAHWLTWLSLCTALCIVSVFMVNFYLRDINQRDNHPRTVNKLDPQEIVLDEFIGCLIALAFVPWSWPWVLAGYVLFRFFDMVKPGPIRWVDQNTSGGLGIIGDDAMAGLAAGVLLLIGQQLWPLL